MPDRQGFVRSVQLLTDDISSMRDYPYRLPAVRELAGGLAFHPAVTCLIGENGTGKSTLLEGIAAALGFNPEGGTRSFTFSTAATHSELHRHLRIARGTRHPQDGFFFRAESYYNLATEIDALDREPSFGPPLIDSYGGKSLHMQSHGESFFATFLNRFGGRGLYLLDEPEAALSPSRQLAMLARLHQLARQGSQFIIATHSPILMAYPDSYLYVLTPEGIERRTYAETEHFAVMKAFVNKPEAMLAELFRDDED